MMRSGSSEIRPKWATPLAVIAGLFGLMTLIAGGQVLFVDGGWRVAMGDYVPFVVWFNFLTGFAYLAGTIGLVLWKPWLAPLALAVFILTLLVFAAFGIHILAGGTYEMRTVAAMSARSLVWLGIFFASR